MPTITQLLDQAAAALAGRSDSPRLDAELLLAHALRSSRGALLMHGDRALDAAAQAAFAALLERRRAGEPVAYLVGHREFWTLELAVDARVLVPRPESELLVELALQRLPTEGPCRVLDLGTGSGALAIALAVERPAAEIIGTDASAGALAVARDNAAACEETAVEFREGPWWTPVAGERFDLIVANPPYLAADDPHLADPALRCEPRAALVAGPTGLEALAVIAAGARSHLAHGGWLIVEHGATQGEPVRRLFADAGLDEVATHRDLSGHERATLGRSPG